MCEKPSRRTRLAGAAVSTLVLVALLGGCGGGEDPSPLGAGGDVVAILHTDGAKMLAYEAERGARLWESIGGPVAGVWASDDRFLLLAGGQMEQRTASTGELQWSTDLVDGLGQVGVIDDRIVAVVGRDVRAFDLASGRVAWSWSGADGSNFLFGGGRVVVEDADRRIVALDLDSGRELWRSDVQLDVNFDVTMRPRSLRTPWYRGGLPTYLLTEDAMFLYEDYRDERDLVVLDASTGVESWRIAGINHFGVATVDDTLLVVAKQGVAAFDLGSGEDRWSLERAVRTATVYGDMLLASGAGTVFGVDIATGVLQWETSLDASVIDTAGSLVIAVSNEKTYGLEPSSGETAWEAPFSGQGRVVLREPGNTTDGLLVAVERLADDNSGTIETRLMGIDVASGETRWIQIP